MAQKHTLFITGAAGYVGAMLCDQFSKRDDVACIIGLDREPCPALLAGNKKVQWIRANTAEPEAWCERASALAPDIVIHAAWQIRELYGKRSLEWKWNIDGSDAIFDFALTAPSVRRLIHFSTVASYGAFADNTREHRFTENEPFRTSPYLYAEEKRVAEEHLKKRYAESPRRADVIVSVVRPAAITGPRGRFDRIRFGLQAALSGSLAGQGSFLYTLISWWVSWVPVTPKWLRQYVHEDDITDIAGKLSFDDLSFSFEAFNLAPPGAAVLGEDMARAVGKRTLPIRPWMACIAFFVMWHLTRGRIPTAPGSWRGYSYPIAVDGSKVTRLLNYTYRMPSYEAFTTTKGRYEHCVPEELRRP